MDRTSRAALVAAVIAFAAVGGLGVLLGLPAAPSLTTGAVIAVVSALLIHAAARRAESFHHPDEPGER
jgi:membrane protein implicated in regulation of membrane protease activity